MSLRRVYEESEGGISPSIGFAEVFGDVANYFWERNMFANGLLASESATNFATSSEGKFTQQQGHIFTLEASLRLHFGISDRSKCCSLFHRALVLRQQYMNNLFPGDATEIDIINYANAWSNVGCALAGKIFIEPSTSSSTQER